MSRIEWLCLLLFMLETRWCLDHFKERVISYRKPVEISSQWYDWAPSRVVNGDYRTKPSVCNCCAATINQANPWLRVDLEFEHRVSRVVIYGSTDAQYAGQNFAGMAISLDSTNVHTIPTSTKWIDFYEYPLATMRLATSVTLMLVGNRKQLVVCELLVYGDCKKGFFSDSCNKQCHCEGEPCPTTSGICPSGRCEHGYQTETCSKPCDAGDYGQNCSMKCGNCKDGQICDHVTGYCGDCKPGYILTDPLCKTSCTDGRYGYNCSKTCGKCRDGETCNFETGLCTQCEDGYKYSDLLCMTACNNGTYGTNCTNTCGNCRDDDICDKVNGHCTECGDGYIETDRTCKTSCGPGFYGRNCKISCGSCKDDAPCNHLTGSCEDCMNGTFVFNDRLCNKDCEPYTYGYNCTDNCGNCRDNAFCNRVNGNCEACEDGYVNEDRHCNTVCGWDTYGFNCENHCGNCFDNETCDRVNGSCSECAGGYFGMLCVESLVQSPNGDDKSNTVVIIGAIIPVVLIIVIVGVVVFVVIKKRRPYKQHQDSPTAQPHRVCENTEVFDNVVAIQNEDQEHSVPVEENNDHDHDYYAFTKTVPGILIHQLWDYIAMSKGDGFLNEYETLKEGLIHPHNDAITNRKKNRYREMFPYDHSRVHLEVERPGESEFINASHIDGFERERKFIASQGPIDVMVVDFWRMVWQQNTRKIVMLTNLVENGNNKCMQYWPDEGKDEYERISIRIVKEDKKSDYVIRTLDIAQDDDPPRRIEQYHYRAWPDKSVPDSTWSLTQFWREVFRDENKSPVVVHCSAGVGRTGTFIAMDNLYHQAIITGSVKPLKVVERLRDQRVKMVQTSEQYEFLHEAVADTLLFGTHYLWQSQYPGYYDFMLKKDQAIDGKVRLTHQFELLKKSLAGKPLRAIGGENKANAKEWDEYKPKGSTRSGTGSLKFLPSLGGSDSFMLTTIPDAKTLTECFGLVDEHNVRTVITLMDVAQQGDSIWGSINTQNCDKYKPVLGSTTTVGFVTERSFTYSKETKTQASNQDAKVKQMELRLSTSADPSKQADSVARVFDVISEWHPYISTKEPVLIQCRDGVTYCGIMAVLLNEKLRILKNGGQIHILDSVKKIKSADQSMISSYNQYKFIHDILLHVLKERDPLYSEADAAEADLDDENIYQNT